MRHSGLSYSPRDVCTLETIHHVNFRILVSREEVDLQLVVRMDLNVCSRRVHDGYATIRSRGRPRAVYRSDSEELLKEAGGPYDLPRLSNFRVVPEDGRQVPRWSDLGRDQSLIENYGTLRVARSRDLEEPRKVTLKTFSRRDKTSSSLRNGAAQSDLQRLRGNNGKNCEGQKSDRPADIGLCNRSKRNSENCSRYGCDRRMYDTVPAESDPATVEPFYVAGRISLGNGFATVDNNRRDMYNRPRENVENLNNRFARDSGDNCILKNVDNPNIETETAKRMSARDSEGIKNDLFKSPKSISLKNDSDSVKRGSSKHRQPVYAVPQVLSKQARRERRLVVVDENYVPSGDLYRTTAKYIEDINRNLAEIDKSYEEMKDSPRTYGVINRIAKGELQNQSGNLFGYARKRDMAPMPPISTDIDEMIEEKNDREFKKDAKYFRKPNSKGRLPPKILPRSSSIENTSRHSTGSTTASSSKSTESLYAISESLTELPKIGDFQRQDLARLDWNKTPQKLPSRENNLQGQIKSNTERDIPKKVKSVSSKDSSSSTDEDVSISKARTPVIGAIRRNRSRVDQAERPLLRKERGSNDVLERVPSKVQTRSLEDRRYDTLPSRRPRISSRPLHKSSEDVLDGERNPRKSLQSSCSSNNDVIRRQSADEDSAEVRRGPVYMMDATEAILKGQLERSNRLPRQDCLLRTRHNSLESDVTDGNVASNGFATLPRRGNLKKDQTDTLRRFSGNGSILEPLYEHAVSDSVTSRGTQNVIPWWELATRKYRHRSCPSLQVI